MSEPALEWHTDGYTLSTSRSRLDLEAIHRYLSKESYLAYHIKGVEAHG